MLLEQWQVPLVRHKLLQLTCLMVLQKCTACGMQKPAEEFQHDRCKPDGLRGCCKPCETKKGRARSQARAPCMTPTVANKMCSRCREVKSADYFGRCALLLNSSCMCSTDVYADLLHQDLLHVL